MRQEIARSLVIISQMLVHVDARDGVAERVVQRTSVGVEREHMKTDGRQAEALHEWFERLERPLRLSLPARSFVDADVVDERDARPRVIDDGNPQGADDRMRCLVTNLEKMVAGGREPLR